MDTAIFRNAESAAQGTLATTDPDRVALYEKQLVAMGPAMEKQRLGNVETVSKAILRAAEATRPKNLYTAGADARMAGVLARFPAGLRDRLITRMFGLNQAAGAP